MESMCSAKLPTAIWPKVCEQIHANSTRLVSTMSDRRVNSPGTSALPEKRRPGGVGDDIRRMNADGSSAFVIRTQLAFGPQIPAAWRFARHTQTFYDRERKINTCRKSLNFCCPERRLGGKNALSRRGNCSAGIMSTHTHTHTHAHPQRRGQCYIAAPRCTVMRRLQL